MKRILVILLALAAIAQPSDAQFFKKLGKAISDAAKEAVSDTPKNTTQKTTTPGNTTSKKVSPRKPHLTSSTKTITVDGGVERLGSFSNGRAIVTGRKCQFVIDRQGSKVFDIPAGFTPKGKRKSLTGDDEGVGYDSNRLMVYSRSEQTAVIYDEKGNVVKKFTDTYDASGFCDGVAVIQKENKKPGQWTGSRVWYHIDTDGNILSKDMPVSSYTSYTYRLFPLSEGLSPVYDEKAGAWGFRNAKCQWVIQPRFKGFGADDDGGFHNGLSRAMDKDSEKWGYIDQQGQWVIQPTFTTRPCNFYGIYALVKDKSGRIYFIDKTGKFVWQEQTPGAFVINQFLPNNINIWCDDAGCYLIDASFKKKCRIDQHHGGLTAYTDSYFQWHSVNDAMYDVNRLIDYDGNILLEFGDCGGTFAEGICTCENFYFNDKGEVIVRFEDTKF